MLPEEERAPLDLTDECLTAEARLDLLLTFLRDNATTSAAWPKMDQDERGRLREASVRLERWISSIKSTASASQMSPHHRDGLFSELTNALVAAWEIGMYGNVTESAGIHYKVKRAVASAKKGMPAREQKVDDRRRYVAEQRKLIRAKNPTLAQDDVIERIRENWDCPGSVAPSSSTLAKDFAALNKS